MDYKKIERIEKLLAAKEDRFNHQKYLIKKYGTTLISFMLNIPGEIKSSDKTRKFQEKYIEKIERILKENDINILYREFRHLETGDEYFASVREDAKKVKMLMIDLEESKREARLLDIDVFDKDFHQISRDNLDYSPRKCLLCNKSAKYCMRMNSHKIEDLITETEKLLEVKIWKRGLILLRQFFETHIKV